jgi:hypothetical protein
MYLTYSPCGECSDKIKEFVENQPDIFRKLNIRFSSVYKHYRGDIMCKLRELPSKKIILSVFTDEDWENLEKHLVSRTIII